MNRRLELLTYGLVACIQVYVAWLVFSRHYHRDLPALPAAAMHAAAPVIPAEAQPGNGAQSAKRHF